MTHSPEPPGTATPAAFAQILRLADDIPDLPRTRRGAPKPDDFDAAAVEFALDGLNRSIGSHVPADLASLIDACLRIANWAEYCHEPATALGFVQAAIRLHAPFEEGRRAARQGKREQAEKLFDLAIAFAQKAGNWEQAAKSWTQLGRLHLSAGDSARAVDAHAAALRIARKHGLKTQEAHALHNLAVMAFHRKDAAAGLAYARLALDAYRDDYAGIRILANDLAWYWMTSEGAYEHALPIFEAILESAHREIDRLDIAANVARAAAGAAATNPEYWAEGARKFDAAWERVMKMSRRSKDGERVAGALLELGEGALMLGRVDEARKVTEQALALAEQRHEARYARDAKKLLERLGKNPVAAKHRRRVRTGRAQLVQLRTNELVARIVSRLNASLAR